MPQRILPPIPRTAVEKRLLPPVPFVVRSMLHSQGWIPSEYTQEHLQTIGKSLFSEVMKDLSEDIESLEMRLEVLTWAEKFKPFVKGR